MRFHRLQALILMPLFSIVATQSWAQEHHTHTPPAHTQGDAAYQAKRHRQCSSLIKTSAWKLCRCWKTWCGRTQQTKKLW